MSRVLIGALLVAYQCSFSTEYFLKLHGNMNDEEFGKRIGLLSERLQAEPAKFLDSKALLSIPYLGGDGAQISITKKSFEGVDSVVLAIDGEAVFKTLLDDSPHVKELPKAKMSFVIQAIDQEVL